MGTMTAGKLRDTESSIALWSSRRQRRSGSGSYLSGGSAAPRALRLALRAPLLELGDERLAVRRMPVLEQHLLEREAIDRGVVASVVVHRQMHAVGVTVQGSRRA